jgi:tRNA (uracil-5-)-methyltransferase TRM9
VKPRTISTLNAINRRFYEERAAEFSATRERPWTGWTELLDRVEPLLTRPPSVLDVGCGNGRFARFLEQRGLSPFSYWGIDASLLALDEARSRFGARDDRFFLRHDFVEAEFPVPAELSQKLFDLVAVFGVLHHVPGRLERLSLARKLARKLASGGVLVLTAWRFDRYERFVRRLLTWREYLDLTGIDLDVSDLERGDYVMTWGAAPPGFRYCHALQEDEEEEIVRALDLELVARFDAENEPNRYFAFQHRGSEHS